jgi:high affinity Mn2+ porin
MTRINLFFFILIATAGHAQLSRDSSRFQLHFQQTVVTQYHPDFNEKYSGPKSMAQHEDAQISLTTTCFTGVRLSPNTVVYFNPEIAGGAGLSGATGVAGFTNGETFRIGNPKPQVYVARFYLSHYFPLSNDRTIQFDAWNQLAGSIPTKYIRVVAGRFAVSDFFDNNSYSHDPRSQFLNWALMGNGAFDYAANTRGYTYGSVVEIGLENYAFRIGAAMVPREANLSNMDPNIGQAHALQAEAEYHWGPSTKPGVVRVLVYQNSANMGNYQQAVNGGLQSGVVPDIISTRQVGRTKTGIGINLEKRLTPLLGVFARASINDGKNETWMFTEIDQSVSGGVLGNTNFKNRKSDTWGIAGIVNGISKDHQALLVNGGNGFMIGDGALTYAPEIILEMFYNADVHDDHFYITPDYQFIVNPAYNSDRGPIHVLGIRVHTRF